MVTLTRGTCSSSVQFTCCEQIFTRCSRPRRRCNTAFTAARVRGTIVSLQLQGTNIININEVRGRTVNHGFSVVKKTEKASVLLVLHARLLFDSGRKLRL